MPKTRKKSRTKKRSASSRPSDWRPKQRQAPLPTVDQVTCEQLLESTGCWPELMLVDVGTELHAGRSAEPLADEQLSYDDCIGVAYRPFTIETCGFRISAEPRRIGVREVASVADRSCKRCHGLGYWPVERRVQAGTDMAGNKQMQDVRFEQSCSCADGRYKRQNRRFLIDSQLGEWIALDRLTIERLSEEETSGSMVDG